MKERGPAVEDLRRVLDESAEDCRPTPHCPELEELWEAQCGEESAARIRDIIDHTVACPACAEAWRVAHAMGAMEELTRRRRAVPAWRLGLAAAAVLVLAIGLATILPPAPPDGDAGWRSGPVAEIQSLIPETTPLARGELVLRWSAGPQGSIYDVHVTTESFAPVATAEGLDRPEWRVPEEQLAAIAGGTRLLWRVDALLPDGRRAESPTFFVLLE